jgi:uncharacterized membrane protein
MFLTKSRSATIHKRVYGWTLLGASLWLSAVIFAPILKSRIPLLSAVIYAGFSPTCHQLPDRCFYIFGDPMAVCARCFGVYTGFFIGLLFFIMVKKRFKRPLPSALIFVLFSIPIGIDTAANFLYIWQTPSVWRFFSGIIWGTLLPYYFVVGVSEFFVSLRRKKP